ncbi:MAG TPA: POTRA domain-containing protein, partial [Polyangiaceae bacterium]|nr:POTRA domain-containing protein [Polyangiaceae bacterium]
MLDTFPGRRLAWWLTLVSITLLTAGRAYAQDADSPEHPVTTGPHAGSPPPSETDLARGLPIVAIEVLGNRRVTKEDVKSYLRERVGQAFAPESLSKDVRELWGSGFFDDVEVDLQRSDNGVTLRFNVRERSNVSKVEFDQNDEIDDDDLKEAIEVKENTVLSYPAIQRSIQKIRDMYAEKGYFLA